ncbi:ATP/GTP nucleotide-binding protein [Histomonas meleagridis]|uniref:ATP/GTP nucleotide-binding protein n=1 Tax=Histomonas meleagridis TaxID=135588 RepID=UPI00355A272F|nr:ATP/GTP nucleotide-binding protein [Histomonas meleagridis]KAH0802818.1 ATP/GTP nucleotide-binding protein [Histomonas meleagridis]
MNWNLLTSFVNKDLVDPSQIHQEHRRRNIRSKYDYISIRVKIEQYEYVFSRFSLSRYLMACMVPPSQAVDISRKIKEEFVDQKKFEITQDELTQRVFELISTFDNSPLTQKRFHLIQNFNLERIPLIIFISGTGFVGKSNLAFQLGERLNVSTILQTDIVCALTSNSGDHLGRALWYTSHKSVDEFMDLYHQQCKVATDGIEGDIFKTLTDGKPLIVEGIHLNPNLFLHLCGQNALNPLDGFNKELFGRQPRGKQGFILPILLTRQRADISNSIRSSIFGSTEKRQMKLDVPAIVNYALAVQDEMIKLFPKEYVIDCSGADAINHIHTLFLEHLEKYYAEQEK